MGERRTEAGQTAVEYLGMVLLAASIVIAIAATGLPDRLGDLLADQVCRISQPEAECDGSAARRQRQRLSRRQDPDQDGLTSRQERRLGTATNKADSDGDGITDGDEVKRKLNPKSDDTDADGLTDAEEIRLGAGGKGPLNPRDPDGDDDGLLDGQELAAGTDLRFADSDGEGGALKDGLTDYEEIYEYGTDPNVEDTDGDGASDGNEVKAGTNPTVDERDLLDKLGPEAAGLFLDDPFGFGKGGALKKAGKGVKDLFKKLTGKGAKKEAEDAIEEAQQGLRKAADRRKAADEAKRPDAPTDAEASPPLAPDRLEHIKARHGPDSTALRAGKFSPGTTDAQLRRLIDAAAASGTRGPNTRGRPGQIIERDFGSPIGTNGDGRPATRLRLVLDENGRVKTAFPF